MKDPKKKKKKKKNAKKQSRFPAVLLCLLCVAALIGASVALHSMLNPQPTEPTTVPTTAPITAPTTSAKLIDIPDFSAMQDVSQAIQWATQNGMLLQITYLDNKGNTHTEQPEGTVLGIGEQQPSAGTSLKPGRPVQITVQVQLPLTIEDLIIGSWNRVEYDLASVCLDVITFHADGTFNTVTTKYLPMKEETELSLFGAYWGAPQELVKDYGNYFWRDGMLILEYTSYDSIPENDESVQAVYRAELADGELKLCFVGGNPEPSQAEKLYLSGATPDPELPLPDGVYSGSWVLYGDIFEYENQDLDQYYCIGGKLTLQADGSFALEIATLRKNYSNGWYYEENQVEHYRGTYTADGRCITLQYTARLDEAGQWAEVEKSENLLLTAMSERTEAEFGAYGICDIQRVSRDPAYNGDWIEYLLDLMTQRHP